ncbi:hypothetical protein VCHE09_2884, partial [Vibrio paracholerae HE-09]
MPLLKWQP